MTTLIVILFLLFVLTALVRGAIACCNGEGIMAFLAFGWCLNGAIDVATILGRVVVQAIQEALE